MLLPEAVGSAECAQAALGTDACTGENEEPHGRVWDRSPCHPAPVVGMLPRSGDAGFERFNVRHPFLQRQCIVQALQSISVLRPEHQVITEGLFGLSTEPGLQLYGSQFMAAWEAPIRRFLV